MTQVQQHDPIYRTTPERTTKMMVIMLGICIAGGGIFFGMWDYWTSMPPPAGLLTGDVGDDHSSGSWFRSCSTNWSRNQFIIIIY